MAEERQTQRTLTDQELNALAFGRIPSDMRREDFGYSPQPVVDQIRRNVAEYKNAPQSRESSQAA